MAPKLALRICPASQLRIHCPPFMQQTQDLRVIGTKRLQPPRVLKSDLPVTERANRTVVQGRATVQNVLARRDSRLLVVIGPCSIHDPKGAMEYAHRLATLSRELSD